VQDFFFGSFKPEGAAFLTGILAAVDGFSFGHGVYGVRRLVGALFLYFRDLLELKSGDKSPHSKSLSRGLVSSQLFCLGNLRSDCFQLFRPSGQKLEQLLPLLHGFLIIAGLIGSGARQVKRLMIVWIDLQRPVDGFGWFAGQVLAVRQGQSLSVIGPDAGVLRPDRSQMFERARRLRKFFLHQVTAREHLPPLGIIWILFKPLRQLVDIRRDLLLGHSTRLFCGWRGAFRGCRRGGGGVETFWIADR